MLSPTLAQQYPNGVSVSNVVLTLDAPGKTISVSSDAPPQMRDTVEAWAKGVTFAPENCTPQPYNEYNGVDFFPPSSGVVGIPVTIEGVDFYNRTYSGGSSTCKSAALKDNYASGAESEYSAYVQDAFSGTVGGATVAVVVVRCEYNGHGFDSFAQAFQVGSGSARLLAKLGEGGMNGPDSPLPDWPGGWIHVSFRDGLLYADVWDYNEQCNKTADWLSTTYALRNGKLVVLGRKRHHRSGLAIACGES